MSSKTSSWHRALKNQADKPTYPVVVAFFGFVDYLTIFLPIDIVFVCAVLIRPKNWIRTTLAMTVGSTLGGAAIAWLGRMRPLWVEEFLLTDHETALAVWGSVSGFFREWGALAIAVSAIVPIPQHPILLIAAASGMPFGALVAAFLVGRLAKFGLLAWGVREFPHVLHRVFPSVARHEPPSHSVAPVFR